MIGLPERRLFCVQDGSEQNKGGYFEKGSDGVKSEALVAGWAEGQVLGIYEC